jgi:alpha-tubulin suppressor-like RCC1 family protein
MSSSSSSSVFDLCFEVPVTPTLSSTSTNAIASSTTTETDDHRHESVASPLLTKAHDVLFVCGANSHGQCGIASQRKVSTVQALRLASGQRVLRVACGSAHSALVTQDGLLFMWGANRWGQLGVGSTDNHARPVRVDALEHVIDVACGSQHTLALTHSARVYAFGAAGHGQLGLGAALVAPVKKPTLVPRLASVKCRQVSAGGLHSAALTTAGHVYAWGWGRLGQLGQKTACMYEEPTPVEMPCAIVKVKCGGNHTLALSSTGECYAWGAGSHGQTASPLRQHRRQPRQVMVSDESGAPIDDAQLIVDIDAGLLQTMLLTSAGEVYACGTAEDGELGAGVDVMNEAQVNGAGPVRPVRVLYDRERWGGAPLKHIACGSWHTLAINSAGVAFAWGYGADGRLGLGRDCGDAVPVPQQVTALAGVRIDDVAAGGAHSIFVARRQQS